MRVFVANVRTSLESGCRVPIALKRFEDRVLVDSIASVNRKMCNPPVAGGLLAGSGANVSS